MSGAKLERPGFTSALRAAKAGRFDLLPVYRVNRLSRSVRGLAEVLEILDAAGGGFRSATEPFGRCCIDGSCDAGSLVQLGFAAQTTCPSSSNASASASPGRASTPSS